MPNTYYVIPARKGSKGLPLKNRKLLPFTLDDIPDNKKSTTIVSTDDEQIIDMATSYDVRIHRRSVHAASDIASTKDFVSEIVSDFEMQADDEIVLMYLTYPERTFGDIEEIYEFFKDNNGTSLLCREESNIHPYRAFYSLEGHKGKKIIEHDLCRRQDYPICFMSSYFVAILKVQYLNVMDSNLYHSQTLFYELNKHTVDIDSKIDLETFISRSR